MAVFLPSLKYFPHPKSFWLSSARVLLHDLLSLSRSALYENQALARSILPIVLVANHELQPIFEFRATSSKDQNSVFFSA